MTIFRYKIQEIPDEQGKIAWEAIEESTGYAIPLQRPMIAGAYPEIEQHLLKVHNIGGKLVYAASMGDKFDQTSLTWIFRRGAAEIIVDDIPRGLIRVRHLRPA